VYELFIPLSFCVYCGLLPCVSGQRFHRRGLWATAKASASITPVVTPVHLTEQEAAQNSHPLGEKIGSVS